jgi:hypothetical protein
MGFTERADAEESAEVACHGEEKETGTLAQGFAGGK